MATARRIRKQKIDVLVQDQGSVVGFSGLSKSGNSFLLDDVDAESWQWMGDTLWCDHRCAQGVIDGARDAGLHLGGC